MTRKKSSRKGRAAAAKRGKKRPALHPGTLIASSRGTAYTFDDAAVLGLTQTLLLREASLKQNDIQLAASFYTSLKQVDPDASWIQTFAPGTAFHRVVAKPSAPLDAGPSFAAGGRVHVGMAQVIPQMSSLRASWGLYLSLEKDTAIAEYESAGASLGPNDLVYGVVPVSATVALRLIDFDAAVAHLDQQLPMAGASRIVAEIPYYGAWKYQKDPKLSQVIGAWLAAGLGSSADGIIFFSTKKPGGRNLFLFAADAADLNSRFTAKSL